MSYNTQKDKWPLNELISHYVQEEERLQRDRFKSAHLILTSQNKKTKGVVEGSSQQKKQKKDENFTYYFFKKFGHMKECPRYVAWRVKKGKSLVLVCSGVNLAFVPKDTWWVGSCATTQA